MPEDQPELAAEAEEVGSTDVVPDDTPSPQPPPPDSPDDFKPPSTELVVTPEPADVYRAMDLADEEQILDELQGRMLSTWVYSFKQSGVDVTDLSYAGVNEAVRTLNRHEGMAIRVSPTPPIVNEVTEDGEAYYRVMVYAENTATGSGEWGTAVEPKLMTLKSGDKKWDKFALTKALNKAQRNALKTQIPSEYRETMIGTYLEQEDRVKRLKSTADASVAELPAPAVGEEADELREQIRAVYQEVREVNKVAVTPGAFDSYMHASDHSVEKMRELKRWLEKKLAEVKEAAKK